jgi:hypothetical protein
MPHAKTISDIAMSGAKNAKRVSTTSHRAQAVAPGARSTHERGDNEETQRRGFGSRGKEMDREQRDIEARARPEEFCPGVENDRSRTAESAAPGGAETSDTRGRQAIPLPPTPKFTNLETKSGRFGRATNALILFGMRVGVRRLTRKGSCRYRFERRKETAQQGFA